MSNISFESIDGPLHGVRSVRQSTGGLILSIVKHSRFLGDYFEVAVCLHLLTGARCQLAIDSEFPTLRLGIHSEPDEQNLYPTYRSRGLRARGMSQ